MNWPGCHDRDPDNTPLTFPASGWSERRWSRRCRGRAGPDLRKYCHICSRETAESRQQCCSCSCCFETSSNSATTDTIIKIAPELIIIIIMIIVRWFRPRKFAKAANASVSVFIQRAHIRRLMQSEERREDRCYLFMWWRKWNVLRWDLKAGNVLHWRMSSGSSIQTRGPDTEKRRSPRVVSVRDTDDKSSLECVLVRVASTCW